MNKQQELELVLNCIEDRHKYFSEMVALFGRQINRTLAQMAPDMQDMHDDIKQDVWIKVYYHLGTLQTPGKFRYWLNSIVMQEVYRQLRLRRHVRFVSLDACPHVKLTQREKAQSSEFYDALYQAIFTIQDCYRDVIILRIIKEKSYEEIAKLLQVSKGTVKSRLNRGREILKAKILESIDYSGANCKKTRERIMY